MRLISVMVLMILSLNLQADFAYAKSKKSAAKPYSPRYAEIVVDAETGMVLSQENADWQLFPASLTKLMTLLLAFEDLSTGKIKLNSPVRMSAKADAMPPSKLPIKVGGSITVEQAIKALVTKSANNVAVALAETLGGSERNFVYRMNLKAREIGMTNTHFENASGWHNVRQVSSARDMAKLALYVLYKYPSYYKYFALKNFYFNGANYANHNKLMSNYRGMDGMKTGYVAASGFNLVASAKRDGVRLVGVVFGGKSASSRNAQMAKILDAGFAKHSAAVRHSAPRSYIQNAPQVPSARKLSSMTVPSATAPVIPLRKNPATSGATGPTGQTGFKTLSVTAPSAPQPSTQSTSLTRETPAAPYGSTGVEAATNARNWQIQIGAFQDRNATDRALYAAQKKLPQNLQFAVPLIAPLRTSDAQWVFRARFSGLTRSEALEACRVLGGCLTIAPTAGY